MVKSQNEEDIKLLRRYINMWREQDMAAYRKRKEAGEIIQNRNSIYNKRLKSSRESLKEGKA